MKVPINHLLIGEPLEYKLTPWCKWLCDDKQGNFSKTEYWKYFVCVGKSMALSACGFQMGVQAENIQRLHPHLLCSTALLTVQRWALIFYTINCVVPKMDSGQVFDGAACLGSWIPRWVSLPLFNILIVLTTTTTKFLLITGALGRIHWKKKKIGLSS